jgi:6-phosphogluconolactonase
VGPPNDHQRITLTYHSINQAERVTFLVSGSAKSDILKKVLEQNGTKSTCPAARIKPRQGRLQWYIDASAAVKLNNISSD